jgi:hypothetical protein
MIRNEHLREISYNGDFRVVGGAKYDLQPIVQCSHILVSGNILVRLQMGKSTITLTIICWIGEGIECYLMFDYSGQEFVILTSVRL